MSYEYTEIRIIASADTNGVAVVEGMINDLPTEILQKLAQRAIDKLQGEDMAKLGAEIERTTQRDYSRISFRYSM